MDQRLRQAAQDGDIEAFYRLVGTEPSILEQIDERLSFVETPLHVAAYLGHTEFAMEMMRLKPSFVRKPNQDGFTPIHLALQNQNINQQLVLALVKVDPDLVRVKGREGETPLHYVARKGNLDLLAEFLFVCPDSIKDVTICSETPLHVALKYNMVEAFQVLLGWLERGSYDNTSGLKETILNWKNNEGNTVLHIATSNNLPQVVRMLLRNRVDVNVKNLRGLTALDILECQRPPLDNQEIKDMLCRASALRGSAIDTSSSTLVDYLRSKVSPVESRAIYIYSRMFYMSSGKRSLLLVVAVLITTTTYQAGVSPPGGVWKDDYKPPDLNTTISPSSSPSPHRVGKTVLTPNIFFWFSLPNNMVYSLSMAIIFILLPVDLWGGLLRISLFVLYSCYSLSMLVIGHGQGSLIMFCGFCVFGGFVTSGLWWYRRSSLLLFPGLRRSA